MKLLLIATFTTLPICSTCTSLAIWAPSRHDGLPRKGRMLGVELLLLSFGKTHSSHLLLRKLQELGRKAGLRLGRSQYCGQHADRQHLAWPCNLYFLKCQGSMEAGVRLFLQHSLVPVYPCTCQSEIRGFPAFPSVTSIGSLCPWVVFAFLHQERARETLLFVSSCSLISHTVRLLFAPMPKTKAAFAGVVHSWL